MSDNSTASNKFNPEQNRVQRPDQVTDRRVPASPRLLLLVASLVTLVGYFGPWINHRAAVLVITGLDLGEYVKFLPVVEQGQVTMWREGFYLPLVTVSLALSLWAFRDGGARSGWARPATTRRDEPSASKDAHPTVDIKTNALQRVLQTRRRFQSMPMMARPATWLLRLAMLTLAVIAALNLLPPAWTPGLLLDAEFRLQTAALALCLAAIAISPLLALLPRLVPLALLMILSLASLWFPISGFLRVLPNMRELYNEPLWPGWGMYVMTVGLVLNFGFTILDLRFTKDRRHADSNRKS